MAVTSSVPRVTTALRQMAKRWFDVPCVVLEPGVRSGMPILYDNPKEVGPDRIANAIGAYDLYGGPCIVVDLGTATTFDAISGNGEYLGGAIAPGIAISMDALFHHAAALRRVELVEPRSVIGKSTVESIQSGVLYGYAAQVDGMCRRIIDELGHATVVATGGLSEVIAPLSQCIEHREPWLTLHGLRLVYERNSKPRVSGVVGATGRPGSVAPRGRRPLLVRPDRRGGPAARALRRRSGPGRRATTSCRWPAGSCSCAPRAGWPSPPCATRRVRCSCSRWRRSPRTSSGFSKLSLGDWVGASGKIVRTRKGELSVQVHTWVLLAEARRGFGDKWKGVTDVETRFRQREVDLWANERTREILTLRSRLVSSLRRRLRGAGVRRGRDAGAARHPRRRQRQALRHPPQRAGHRSVPAHRPRALPEAPGRGRLREGVRDRPGVPQRRPVARATTRSSRCSSSTRRTPTTWTSPC